MRLKWIAFASATLAALGAAGASSAHHSFAATYHVDQVQTITGTVAQFMYRNPHSYLHVMAPDKAGKMQRWAVEWGGSAALAGQNVKPNTLKVGDKVTVTGNPGRNAGDHRIRMQKVVRPSDGWSWGGSVD